jgi:hypothetical protein
MNRSHIVIAMLTCMGLCFAAGAAESVNTVGASNGAAVNAAPSREASIKADRVVTENYSGQFRRQAVP